MLLLRYGKSRLTLYRVLMINSSDEGSAQYFLNVVFLQSHTSLSSGVKPFLCASVLSKIAAARARKRLSDRCEVEARWLLHCTVAVTRIFNVYELHLFLGDVIPYFSCLLPSVLLWTCNSMRP